jgi:hypothetical protein
MKTFWPTLAAILVAAVVICLAAILVNMAMLAHAQRIAVMLENQRLDILAKAALDAGREQSARHQELIREADLNYRAYYLVHHNNTPLDKATLDQFANPQKK